MHDIFVWKDLGMFMREVKLEQEDVAIRIGMLGGVDFIYFYLFIALLNFEVIGK